MDIRTFDDLLAAAKIQPQPQRLLFVFVGVELPAQPTKEQVSRFEQRQGGHLVPVMCVDKLPEEIADFAALAAESRHTGRDWDMVFVAGQSGQGGRAPTADEAEPKLKKMVDLVKAGSIGNFVAFDRDGNPVQFY